MNRRPAAPTERRRERVIRPARTIGDVLQPTREPTPMERRAIADVYELAERHIAGDSCLAEIRAATSGKQRWLATRFTPPDHPLVRPLMAMLDALVADIDHASTDQGTVETRDLFDPPAKIVRASADDLERIGVDAPSGDVICFPYAWPWTVKPNPDTGIEGIRNEPRYRSREQWGQPFYDTFHTTPRAAPTERAPEFWEVSDDGDGDSR